MNPSTFPEQLIKEKKMNFYVPMLSKTEVVNVSSPQWCVLGHDLETLNSIQFCVFKTDD